MTDAPDPLQERIASIRRKFVDSLGDRLRTFETAFAAVTAATRGREVARSRVRTPLPHFAARAGAQVSGYGRNVRISQAFANFARDGTQVRRPAGGEEDAHTGRIRRNWRACPVSARGCKSIRRELTGPPAIGFAPKHTTNAAYAHSANNPGMGLVEQGGRLRRSTGRKRHGTEFHLRRSTANGRQSECLFQCRAGCRGVVPEPFDAADLRQRGARPIVVYGGTIPGNGGRNRRASVPIHHCAAERRRGRRGR